MVGRRRINSYGSGKKWRWDGVLFTKINHQLPPPKKARSLLKDRILLTVKERSVKYPEITKHLSNS
jgi:hypothetical protein